MKIKNYIILNVVLLAGITSFSFGEKREATKTIIKISGSSTMHSLMSEMSMQYCMKNPKTSIKIISSGSAIGVKDLLTGNCDVAMISRNLKSKEEAQFTKSYSLFEVARDGVMPVVSDEIFVYLQALTLKQIADIYSGKIKNWKELNGPDKEIFVIDKVKSSGTRSVYMKSLFQDSKADAKGADIVVETTADEANQIRKSDAAIGMLSNAWIDEDIKGLSIILKRKLMRPYKQNIDNGLYPIIRPLNLVTNKNISPDVQDFLKYISSKKGLKIIEKSGYSVVQN